MIKIKIIYPFLFLLVLGIGSDQLYAQCGKRSSQKNEDLKNPIIDVSDSFKNGEKTYKQNCILCHGDAGKGDGMVGKSLGRKPADLTSESFKSKSDSEIYWKITKGIGAMPSFENRLTDMQKWELINYIKTFND